MMLQRRCRSCLKPQRRGFLIGALCVALTLFFGGTGRAAAPSCQADVDCREQFKQASELYLQGQFDAALAAFQAAYARQAEPRILLNIGRTLYKLERPEAALAEYQRCWNSAAPEDHDLFNTLDQYMREARQLLARQKEAAAQKAESAPAAVAVVTAQPERPKEPPPRPVYKKAWFWLVIGGVAAAGIIAGAVAGTQARSADPTPLPYNIAF